MKKEYQELYNLVMMYVDEREKHHIDDQKLEEELQDRIGTIEELAFDIEVGKYDITDEDLKDIHDEAKFDQMRDDEITERWRNEIRDKNNKIDIKK